MRNIFDLTKKIDGNLEIYTNEAYSDPRYRAESWCQIEDTGFQVSKLEMGTQTGTHIDAPCHFAQGGCSIEFLRPEQMVGSFAYFDVQAISGDAGLVAPSYKGQPMLFLSTQKSHVLAENAFRELLNLSAEVWIIDDDCQVASRSGLYFHQTLAEHGRFLVENLDQTNVAYVPRCQEIVIAPLALQGVSGSPCRVLAIQR